MVWTFIYSGSSNLALVVIHMFVTRSEKVEEELAG